MIYALVLVATMFTHLWFHGACVWMLCVHKDQSYIYIHLYVWLWIHN